MHAWFTPGTFFVLASGFFKLQSAWTYLQYFSGECATPRDARDARAQIASLYYAFACDVITDIVSVWPIVDSLVVAPVADHSQSWFCLST
jgi:hypothetical protein